MVIDRRGLRAVTWLAEATGDVAEGPCPVLPEHPEDETFSGLLLLRAEGWLFFANAERVGEKIRPLIATAKPEVVALDLEGVFDLEYTALKMLTEAEKREREKGALLWLVGLTPGVLAMVQHSPLGTALGRERMIFNLGQAVAKHQAHRGRPRALPREYHVRRTRCRHMLRDATALKALPHSAAVVPIPFCTDAVSSPGRPPGRRPFERSRENRKPCGLRLPAAQVTEQERGGTGDWP